MQTDLTEWQAASAVHGIGVLSGGRAQTISLGGYKITLKGGSTPDTNPATGAELAGGVSLESRSLSNDKREFAIVVNTAPDEFLFMEPTESPVSKVSRALAEL